MRAGWIGRREPAQLTLLRPDHLDPETTDQYNDGGNMKVLLIQVDVTNLSADEIDSLEGDMLAQVEEYDADIINSGTKDIETEDKEDYKH